MDLIQKYVEKIFPSDFDFEGQRVAEWMYQAILIASAVIGFVVGFVTQQLSYTYYSVLIGSAIACLVTVPAWPCFRKMGLKWLPPVTEEDTSDDSKKSVPTKQPKKPTTTKKQN